jgi:hypothetical protein
MIKFKIYIYIYIKKEYIKNTKLKKYMKENNQDLN